VMRCAASYHRGEQPGQRVHVGRGAHNLYGFLQSGGYLFFAHSVQRCCCWADITASSRVPGGDASQCADAEPLWELHIVCCCFGCHVFLPTTARRLANVPTAAEDAQLLK
jgi:hypothetical protein